MENKPMSPQTQAAMLEFLHCAENVLHTDWEFTLDATRDRAIEDFIAPGGTFLVPLVEDPGNNWGSRCALLSAHRTLIEALAAEGIYRSPTIDS
jgi:hypothetical protein